MAGWLRRWRRPPPEIAEQDWRQLLAAAPLLAGLASADRDRLRTLSARFLARKSFAAAGGHELEPFQCLAIAAQACLPVLHLGFAALAGWREVIVYPGEFRVRREHHDEPTGVVTEGEDILAGEAWDRGPLVLSWADVAEDLAHPFEGFNVVIHEIAHKLDMGDGAMNGTPALPRHLPVRDWVAAMQPAYDALVETLERGDQPALDPYAAEGEEEFFAVTSELHFSAPAWLAEAEPAVAAVLARYYGPAPH